MRALLSTLLTALLLSVLYPSTSHADRLDCTGYPQSRQFVDTQSWWTTTPGKAGTDHGHLHVAACIPERETLAVDQTLDVRLTLHNNPGKFPSGTSHGFSLVAKTPNSETTPVKVLLGGWNCPVGTCEKWISVPLRVSFFDRSGLQEVRFRAFVDEPDGNRMIASLNWQTIIQSGALVSNVTRYPWVRGKGWYTTSKYCEAAMKTVPLPDAPLTGTWSPRVSLLTHSSDSSLPVTYHSVRLDPDFHAVPPNPGTVLREGVGPWEGVVPVDTSVLSPGKHRLVARADCDDPRGSTNAGVLVTPFVVG